jgi:dihydrofolate reductase
MAKVGFDISISLDGFIAGPNDSPDNGLGDGGERLHEWAYGLESFHERHGREGGEASRDSELLEEAFATTGAVVLGKRMFDNAEGWGEEPPFRVPVFILTHEAREPLEKKGGTTFTFVDGAESALDQAKEAAGDQDVSIGGGANTIQQYLNGAHVDEFQLHIVPLLLGAGIRLFDGVDAERIKLERTRVVDSPAVTHVRFRVAS